MDIDIKVLPSDIKTVTVRLRKKAQYRTALITFPQDIVDRYDIQDGEDVVICFLGKADINQNEKPA